jgi:hypothetical protein
MQSRDSHTLRSWKWKCGHPFIYQILNLLWELELAFEISFIKSEHFFTFNKVAEGILLLLNFFHNNNSLGGNVYYYRILFFV